MFQGFGGAHFLVLLIIVLLLFAAPKLPSLAKNLGQSMRIFKKEVRQMRDDDPAAGGTDASTTERTPTPGDDAGTTREK